MKPRLLLVVPIALAAGLLALWAGFAFKSDVNAQTKVFSSPINGGCYISAENQCKLHVDPFAINLASGSRLVEFKLQSNGQTIYHFTTDVSNPPGGTSYSPSLVAMDFAAKCGSSYVLNIVGRDSADTNLLNMGQTAQFTCPSAVP